MVNLGGTEDFVVVNELSEEDMGSLVVEEDLIYDLCREVRSSDVDRRQEAKDWEELGDLSDIDEFGEEETYSHAA